MLGKQVNLTVYRSAVTSVSPVDATNSRGVVSLTRCPQSHPIASSLLPELRTELTGQKRSVRFIVFFFFQAEDGIRDVAVTGVQTCALPICISSARRRLPLRCDAYPACGFAPRRAGRCGARWYAATDKDWAGRWRCSL